MSLIKLALPPGLRRVGTIYEAAGRWYDSNLVRWHERGSMQPIGGWTQRTTSAMTGKARAIMTWVDNSSLRWIMVGTHSNLYAFSQTAETPSDITPALFTTGDADATSGAGYGVGPYGESTYGTPRVDNATVQPASMWTMDTFGQVPYMMMAEDSYLYKWDLNVSNVATRVTGAPQGSAVVVTPERFIFVLGSDGDNRKVRWADQESDSDWTAGATDQAGDQVIETQGKLMCGKRIRGGTLIWTDVDVHFATYIAQPFVYRFDRVGENCGICSRGAAVVVGNRAMWMGLKHFYSFDGTVQEVPCEVHDAVFGDFNTTQRSKVTAFHNAEFSEGWWFYPGAAATEIDRAVAYNYQEDTWALHSFSRLAAAANGAFNNPIMADSSGDLWDHETGYSYSSATPYAKSGPIELGDGDNIMRARRLIADETTAGDVNVNFITRDWPNDSETTYGPYSPANPTSVRFSARQVRLHVVGDQAVSWRWGTPRLDVIPGSKR